MDTPPPLHARLLHDAPAPSERRAASRWAYAPWGILVVTLFVAYHASVLVIWNLPSKSLVRDFHGAFLKHTRGNTYFSATRLGQSWAMFAPNPTRANTFVHVYVEDQQGGVWDFEQDIWGDDRYPYVWYSRMGKINRRIDGKKNYQRIYGAWVCREWERMHGGEPARSVSFVRRSTLVPYSADVIQHGGWDQWQAPAKQVEQETIDCRTITQGQLPTELRERYGLPPLADEALFRPIQNRTWWDRAEAERQRLEREAKRAAAGGRPAKPIEPREDDDGPGDDESLEY
jgi:hypothetical protein